MKRVYPLAAIARLLKQPILADGLTTNGTAAAGLDRTL